MSAYICNPEHIGALAAYTRRDYAIGCAIYEYKVGDGETDTVRNVAAKLAAENIRSVATRYPNDGDGNRPGPIGMLDADIISEAQDYAEKYLFEWPGLSAWDIMRMAAVFAYQSCETDDWRDTLVYRQIEYIKSAALSSLPEYANAIHDFQDVKP